MTLMEVAYIIPFRKNEGEPLKHKKNTGFNIFSVIGRPYVQRSSVNWRIRCNKHLSKKMDLQEYGVFKGKSYCPVVGQLMGNLRK